MGGFDYKAQLSQQVEQSFVVTFAARKLTKYGIVLLGRSSLKRSTGE